MSERIYIAEGETAELMRRSNGRVLRLGFGIGNVWLQDGSGWEAQELAAIRKAKQESTPRCESCGQETV